MRQGTKLLVVFPNGEARAALCIRASDSVLAKETPICPTAHSFVHRLSTQRHSWPSATPRTAFCAIGHNLRWLHTSSRDFAPTAETRKPHGVAPLSSVSDSQAATQTSSSSLKATHFSCPPVTSSSRKNKADSLLSQWSRRPLTAASASITATAAAKANASTTAESRGSMSTDGLRVEDFFEADGDEESVDRGGSSRKPEEERQQDAMPSRKAKSSNTTRTSSPVASHLDAVLPSAVGTAAYVDATLSAIDNGRGDEDADVYGMLSSSDMKTEVDWMADVLRQQASVDSVLDAEPSSATKSEHGPGDDAAREAADETEDDHMQLSSAFPLNDVEMADAESVRRDSTRVEPYTGSTKAEADSASREVAGDSSAVSVAAAEGDADEMTSSLFEEAQGEDEEGEAEEDASMDTVLEEETEKMLQAALANMARESATKGAALSATATATTTTTTAAAMASSRRRAGTTSGYTFFPEEAVQAAAESLAELEKATAAASPAGDSDETMVSESGSANFDNDAVREAEMESVGLDMETSKRL